MLFEDESMIRDYQAIQKTWFLRGKQRIIPTTGKHRGVKLLATVDYETDIVWQEDEQYTAETFLSFLQKVLATYPTGKLALVLDKCPDSSCKAASAVFRNPSACRAIYG
ncbi:transposase [Paenibacillus larvae]|nr:transposase [Paenibacillus larvae]